MSLLRTTILVEVWFLRASGAFSVCLQVHLLSQIAQRRHHFRRPHAIKHVPLRLGYRDHQPVLSMPGVRALASAGFEQPLCSC